MTNAVIRKANPFLTILLCSAFFLPACSVERIAVGGVANGLTTLPPPQFFRYMTGDEMAAAHKRAVEKRNAATDSVAHFSQCGIGAVACGYLDLDYYISGQTSWWEVYSALQSQVGSAMPMYMFGAGYVYRGWEWPVGFSVQCGPTTATYCGDADVLSTTCEEYRNVIRVVTTYTVVWNYQPYNASLSDSDFCEGPLNGGGGGDDECEEETYIIEAYNVNTQAWEQIGSFSACL